MSRRGVVTDILGNELYKGDLIAYSTRNGNRARQTVAVVEKVTTKLAAGRLIPVLKVRPVADSGFTARRSDRIEHIGAEHVALVHPVAR